VTISLTGTLLHGVSSLVSLLVVLDGFGCVRHCTVVSHLSFGAIFINSKFNLEGLVAGPFEYGN
jgi:hypothetical protein